MSGKTRVAAPSSNAAGSPIYVTPKNILTVHHRIKPLPLDANASATSCRLLQLDEHVEFRCSKCRRDRISDDSLAADATGGVLLCVRCFVRVIKPKNFRPTRLVPFPSLLTWLNHRPPEVRTEVESDVTKRGATAALPSGHRVQHQLIGPTSVALLPKTPMNIIGSSFDWDVTPTEKPAQTETATDAAPQKHPCLRVFGSCRHGALCRFAEAPWNLSLSFLMGLPELNEGEVKETVFDLPPQDPVPARSDAAAFAAWVAKRKSSTNQAEWQLWNNEAVDEVVERCLPRQASAMPISAVKGLLGSLNSL